MTRLGSILLWSAIAAAFIGPGTVTAAASAGAGPGMAVLWAIVFSGVATFTLQEFAGRLAIATGGDLAAVLRRRYSHGAARLLVLALVAGAVLLGCAAYEAGNILGGVAGAMLAIDLPRSVLTLPLAIAAVALLLLGSPQRIAQAMAVFVALMGAGFLLVAASLAPSLSALASGIVPDFSLLEEEAALLTILALVGTTVVPYNLFLGSALARGQTVAQMRLGLAIAVGLGALITAAILVVGTALDGELSFDALADTLEGQLGEWARTGLALGLLAAGLSSAVTAPLAAALTARGLFGNIDDPHWAAKGWRFRGVWAAVILIGAGFGMADVRPGPAILAAQAFNGALLPLVALFLLAAMNDPGLRRGAANGPLANVVGLFVVGIACMLGLVALARVFASVSGAELPDPAILLSVTGIIGLLLGFGAIALRPTRTAP
ncbi:NRAMP family divalent metal transporter [Qipengyuania sp. 902]|uniref:NRAMP family divalent metal transporter n=1 Tax=Qipengyuania sp. 902 TaxID=3417565 RepID=UPI003EBA0175